MAGTGPSLAVDVVFPAGLPVGAAPAKTERNEAHVSVLLALSRDVTAELTLPLCDARELGLIREGDL